LQLEHYPVKEITEVKQNGAPLPPNAYKTDVQSGLIKKQGGWSGLANITYKAGIAADAQSVPKNIQLALWQWVADILQMQETGSLKSESLGDYSVSYYDERQIPSSVALLLEAYRRVSL
jgi:hypothetical protein